MIPIDNLKGNLPVVHNSQLTSKENNIHGSQIRYAFSYLVLRQLDPFGYPRPTNILWHYPTET